MKERFTRYLSEQYKNMTDRGLSEKITAASIRVGKNTEFSENVLRDVINSLREEGYSKAEILAHLNIIDLEYRT